MLARLQGVRRRRPLLHLPTLHDMTRRWQLQVVDQRMLGQDIRLRLRPS